jgi:hypothetical protein
VKVPLPPEALAHTVEDAPAQMLAGEADGATVGLEFTVTVVEPLPVQPLESVTVTE